MAEHSNHQNIRLSDFASAIRKFCYFLWMGVFCFVGATVIPCEVHAWTVFATNVNEQLQHYADTEAQAALRQINAHWVRGFDAQVLTRIGQGRPDPDTDARLGGIKAAAEAGYKVIYSLKFNMDGHPSRGLITDYYPGSEREQGLFTAVEELLDVMAPYIDILVVGNEPFAETNPSDVARRYQSDWGGGICGYPLVIFYDRVSDYVLDLLQSNPDKFGHIEVYCGATQSLHNRTQSAINSWIKAFIEMVDQKEGLVGLDVHIHTEDLTDGVPDPTYPQSRRNLEIVHRFTQKPLLVTEFSLVWRYKAHLSEILAVDEKGFQFAVQYGHAPEMKVYEYLNICRDNPRPQQEWSDFLNSRRWWEPDYLAHMHQLFTEFNVTYAAYRFWYVGRWTVTPDSNPWNLNAMLHVFAEPFEDGRLAESPHFAEDFRRLNAHVFDSLAVHLPFDGHVADVSGHGRDGLIVGQQQYVEGILDGAFSFDENTSIRLLGYKGIEGGVSRTVSVWIKSGPTTRNRALVSWGVHKSGEQFLFGLFSNGGIGVYSGGPLIRTQVLAADGQWRHVAAVLPLVGETRLADTRLYIDGRRITDTYLSSDTPLDTSPGGNVLLIGNGRDGAPTDWYNDWYSGDVAEILVYNRQLTKAEISALDGYWGQKYNLRTEYSTTFEDRNWLN